jgi:long-subunit acyl-CoA synthetase (AMP-forming)
MLGYIKPENPGVVEVPFVERLGNNWYDTGDIVIIDEDGYLTILGKEKDLLTLPKKWSHEVNKLEQGYAQKIY